MSRKGCGGTKGTFRVGARKGDLELEKRKKETKNVIRPEREKIAEKQTRSRGGWSGGLAQGPHPLARGKKKQAIRKAEKASPAPLLKTREKRKGPHQSTTSE